MFEELDSWLVGRLACPIGDWLAGWLVGSFLCKRLWLKTLAPALQKSECRLLTDPTRGHGRRRGPLAPGRAHNRCHSRRVARKPYGGR